jgi:fatty-acyl-CoA synthase
MGNQTSIAHLIVERGNQMYWNTKDAIKLRETDDAWRHRTLWQLLTDVARERPDKEVLVTVDTVGNERRVTYRELVEKAEAFSNGLVKVGVRRGDRLGLWMTNLVEWIPTYFGALRLGVVVVPVNTWLTAPEIAYILRKAGARHLVVLDKFRKVDFTERLTEMAPEWPSSTAGELYSQNLPDLRNVILFSRDGHAAGTNAWDWSELVDKSSDEAERATAIADLVSPEDLALIKFTSGSTGFPKGALLEHWGIVTNAFLHTRRLGITQSDKWFSMSPFFHAGGSIWGLMSTISTGGTLIFTEANDGDLAARLLEEEGATIFGGGRPMVLDIVRSLDETPRQITTIRGALTTDAASIEDLRNRLGVRTFFQPYGMTEVYAPSSVVSYEDTAERQVEGWSKPLDGQELRVVDPATGTDAKPGTVGEIWMRGLVMRGYHDLPEQTAQTIDEDGWIHSQDLAVMDDDGYIHYVGRLKAMLKIGGENVAVEEVEGVIRTFPGVAEAAVIGVPDERYGEAARAYVIPSPGTDIPADDLRGWCTERLARFKVPRDFQFVTELPITGSNKVDRAALIKMDREAAELEHLQA